ncbi:MAG: hypothetical protein FWC34_09950 [Bacteroidetes bacterium]|nr:hypothetical protein [Bacteroidota bacterium]MCL2301895.1 hypothetical protein [Lentimicrobiaceae bacterium]
MKKIFFIIIFFTAHFVHAQDSLNFIISNRVVWKDDADKKEVFELYKNYLYSRPDSIYDNPFWNDAEKKQYYLFDFSKSSIFNGINDDILREYMDLYILSIEKYDTDKFTIRVLMQWKGGLQNGSSVWCIHVVSAIKEDNNWRLQNNFVKETANWRKYNYGAITYHASPDYSINETNAKQANDFINEIILLFDLDKGVHIDYYLPKDVDELGRLQGFDYYFTGIATGRRMNDYIFSTTGEFHAHELIHILLDSDYKRNFIIEEGLAEFLGTKKQLPERYFNYIKSLIADIFSYPEDYSIENLLKHKATWRGYPYRYPFGALICEIIYETKGIDGIKVLAFSNTEENLIEVVSNILEINQDKFEKFFWDYLKEKW